MIKVYFSSELYNEKQGIESIIFRTSNFSTEQISFLACSTVQLNTYITLFCNNEYIIRLSLTSGVTDMGISFFKKRSIKIIRLRKEIVLTVFH